MKKHDRNYLLQLQRRYIAAIKSERKIILAEFRKTSHHEKQYAGKLLRGNYRYTTKPIKRPRRKTYTVVDATILAKVCDVLDWIASKRVQPEIGIAIDSLVKARELVCSKEQRRKLVKISPSTIDRLLKEYKKRPVGKGRSYTKPGTLLKTQIPIRTFADWNGLALRLVLCSADRLRLCAIFLGLSKLNTLFAKSSALLSCITFADHFFMQLKYHIYLKKL